jgi:HAMP domain-containing protein
VIRPILIDTVGGPPITRDGARTDARRELSKTIYHRYDDPWPVRAFNAVQHWINRLLDEVAKHSPGGGAGAVALLVALVVLLAVLRWRLGPISRTPRLDRGVLSETTTTAAEYRRAAVDAAESGDWSAATVARMRALARGLEEAGELAERPGRTADELAAEVALGHRDAADVTASAARIFDEVAYGNRAGSPEGYATVAAADELCLTVRTRR